MVLLKSGYTFITPSCKKILAMHTPFEMLFLIFASLDPANSNSSEVFQ